MTTFGENSVAHLIGQDGRGGVQQCVNCRVVLPPPHPLEGANKKNHWMPEECLLVTTSEDGVVTAKLLNNPVPASVNRCTVRVMPA